MHAQASVNRHTENKVSSRGSPNFLRVIALTIACSLMSGRGQDHESAY